MTTQNEERDVFQPHSFEPFPEPQTIPAGWDTSTILSVQTSDSVQQVKESSETESN